MFWEDGEVKPELSGAPGAYVLGDLHGHLLPLLAPSVPSDKGSVKLGNSSVLRASLIVQLVKNRPAMQETPVRFPGQEDPLEKG